MSDAHTEFLSDSKSKVSRARKHLYDLRDEVNEFIRTNRIEVGFSHDPTTGDAVVRVSTVPELPSHWGDIFGDTIHNLRASLDKIACALVTKNGNEIRKETAFVISDSPAQFDQQISRRLGSAGEAALRMLRELKPYRGGNDNLFLLHQFDIADKHKLTLSINMNHSSIRYPVNDIIGGLGIRVPELENMIVEEPACVELKLGAELYRLTAAQQLLYRRDHQPELFYAVAIAAGQVGEGLLILPTLKRIFDLVSSIVDNFHKQFFSRSKE